MIADFPQLPHPETLPETLIYKVDVREELIAMGRPGAYANPISLALAEALHLPLVGVCKGPSVTPIYDARTSPDAYAMMTTWNAVIAQHLPCSSPSDQPRSKDWVEIRTHDVPLPKHCQYFLNAWNSGPGCGPWAIRNSAGEATARLTYCEIVRPFSFPLNLSFVPGHIEIRDDKEVQDAQESLPQESLPERL